MPGRGRPPKDEASKKSITLGIRVTPALRDQLQGASVEATRTLSQEIEARLRLSFGERQRIQDEFGGTTSYWFLYAVAKGIRSIERHTGHRWFDDRHTYDACRRFVSDEMLPALRPRGRARVPKGRMAAGDLAKHVATTILGLLQLSLSRPDDPDPTYYASLPVAARIKKPALRDLRKRFAARLRADEKQANAMLREVFGREWRAKAEGLTIGELTEMWEAKQAKKERTR